MAQRAKNLLAKVRRGGLSGALTLAVIASLATAPAVEQAPLGDPELLAAARTANEQYRRHLDSLLAQAQGDDPEQRRVAILALGRTYDPTILVHLIEFIDLDDQPADVVIAACHAVTLIGGTEAEPALRALLGADDEAIDRAARNALAQLDLRGSPDHQGEAQLDDHDLRGSGVTNLGTKRIREAGNLLASRLTDPSQHVRRMAAIGLGRLGEREFGDELIEGLTDPDALVRRYTAESLAKLQYTPAIPYLLLALEGSIAEADIARALRDLIGPEFDRFGWSLQLSPSARRQAVDRGFEWWTANAARLRE